MGLGLALTSVIFLLGWLLCDLRQASVSSGQSHVHSQGCCQNEVWPSHEALLPQRTSSARPVCASVRARPLQAGSHDSSIFFPQAFFSLQCFFGSWSLS